jgi:ATP-dependent Lhr-like helicase
VDVERNLRSPLAGMANMARRMGVEFREPTISVRTGDTPQRERARFARHPAEILITTPESLYLLLTSQAAEALRTVDTVIIDEIHALVPTKRGAHLALTLSGLQALTKRPCSASGSPQRSARSKKWRASSAAWKTARQGLGGTAVVGKVGL